MPVPPCRGRTPVSHARQSKQELPTNQDCAALPGIDKIIPVDICIRGCPPGLAQGSLYPPRAGVREVSAHIAAAVAAVAFDEGYAGMARPADLLAHVRACMYEARCPSCA